MQFSHVLHLEFINRVDGGTDGYSYAGGILQCINLFLAGHILFMMFYTSFHTNVCIHNEEKCNGLKIYNDETRKDELNEGNLSPSLHCSVL